jgi:hypothetical protein
MRKVEYTRGLADGSSLAIIIHDDGDEHVLVLTDEYGKVRAFRGPDIAALHDAIHECEQAADGLQAMTETMMMWGETDGAGEQVAALSDSALGMLRMMDKGALVHDNVEGGRCRYATAVATLPEEHLEELQEHKLVLIVEHDELNSRCVWGISDEGRGVVAEHAAEIEKGQL